MAAVHDAVDRFGVGAGGTRNIGGNSSLHESLEAQLAELHGKERALVFSSCFIANDTALETLGEPNKARYTTQLMRPLLGMGRTATRLYQSSYDVFSTLNHIFRLFYKHGSTDGRTDKPS